MPKCAKATRGKSEKLRRKVSNGNVGRRYIVDSRWFKQWKRYVGWDAWDQSSKGNESAMPGPIDNSNLLTGKGVVYEGQHASLGL